MRMLASYDTCILLVEIFVTFFEGYYNFQIIVSCYALLILKPIFQLIFGSYY